MDQKLNLVITFKDLALNFERNKISAKQKSSHNSQLITKNFLELWTWNLRDILQPSKLQFSQCALEELCQWYSSSPTAGFMWNEIPRFFFLPSPTSMPSIAGCMQRGWRRGEKSYLIVNSFWAPMHNVVKCMKKSHFVCMHLMIWHGRCISDAFCPFLSSSSSGNCLPACLHARQLENCTPYTLADSGFFFRLLVSRWREVYSFWGIWWL